MTIRELIRGRSTLDQYTILMRADTLFPVGRYYGGPLTFAEISALTEGIKK